MGLYPPRGSDRKPLKVTDEFLKLKADNASCERRLDCDSWLIRDSENQGGACCAHVGMKDKIGCSGLETIEF